MPRSKKPTKRTIKRAAPAKKKVPAKKRSRRIVVELKPRDAIKALTNLLPTNGIGEEQDLRTAGEFLNGQAEQACLDKDVNGCSPQLAAYSAEGMFDMRMLDRVGVMRERLTYAVSRMIDSALEIAQARNATASERKVYEATHALNIACFESAIDNLEKAIRG